MKNYSDIIGDRTRHLPTCSAVPQPTAPTRTPKPQSDSRQSRLTIELKWNVTGTGWSELQGPKSRVTAIVLETEVKR